MKLCVYPGSFDPVTNGHLDIINRASVMCDKLYVAILNNPLKKSYFTLEEKKYLLETALKGYNNIIIDSFDGLLVDYVDNVKANVIVRGLRAVTDFEYELQLASLNHALRPHQETIFLMTNTKHSYLSSSIVREIGSLGGDISQFVPNEIQEFVKNRLIEKRLRGEL